MNDETKALSQIEVCEQNIHKSKKNIMMMHCSVGAFYLMNEFGEWVYPSDKEYIFKMMDYVALGHWHGFGNVGKHENVYYSGSTERTSLSDRKKPKGFIEISLFDELKVEHKEIKIRPIVLKEIDCEDYENSLSKVDISDTKNTIVEIILKNITAFQSIDIQNSEIKKIFAEALYVNVKREFKKGDNEANRVDVEATSLEEFFLEHIKEDSQSQEFERLKIKVQELFAQYEEVCDDSL
jgi:DNA repair exonuclease SbcCD nuclease subunit